jgi:predicted transcriptional regulator
MYPSIKAAAEDKSNEAVSKSTPTFLIDPRAVKVQEGFNARTIDPEHVAYLKRLKRSGVDTGEYTVQMIDGEIYIRDGHHRHAADLELIAEGEPILRVKAKEFKGDEKAAIFYMLGTQSGKGYTPLQVGEQYSKLVNKYGMSYAEIAEQRGMSEQHVKDAIRLTEQPVELKTAINDGTITSSTALKLVKKVGSTEAIKTIKQAAAQPGVKVGKPITQKVIDKLGDSYIDESKKKKSECSLHLSAMLESPAFDAYTKATIRRVLDLVDGKTQLIPRDKSADKAAVETFLDQQKDGRHSGVKEAAHLLSDVLNKRPLPEDGSPSARAYGHHVWLQDMAATSQKPTFRAAAHWFLAVLNADRSGSEVAPAPSVLDPVAALQAERESAGNVLAETLCPEHAGLIAWARGRA